MKYSILSPYYDRDGYLYSALTSFLYHYSERQDWEYILIEDYKNSIDPKLHQKLMNVLDHFKDKLPIVHLQHKNPNLYNPGPLFNLGIDNAKGKFTILSNPEVYHQENILKGLDNEFNKNEDVYVLCSCFNSDSLPLNLKEHQRFEKGLKKGKVNAWYQHSIYRNKKFHFCSSLSTSNLIKYGKFDERFGEGIAYEDGEFRNRIIKLLEVVYRDDLETIHIHHPKVRPVNFWELHNKNKKLYEQMGY